MGASQEHFGSLYSDERYKPLLLPEAQLKFDYYLQLISELSKRVHETDEADVDNFARWQIWQYGLRQIYKQMIFDAFAEFKIDVPAKMEVHFAGSLAKAQATEFSDLDAFVLLEHDEDVDKVKPIFVALNNLCQRIFSSSRMLFPDPIGINPSKLIGTPDSLFSQLKEGEFADSEFITIALFTGQPILPRYELGEELRSKIILDPDLSSFCTAKKLYDKAINDFVAPPKSAERISIKTHIIRPLDFILMGLREEFNLYSSDGSHLSAPGTLLLLREHNLIPEEDIARIETLYNQVMSKRFALHAEHGKEYDTLAYAEAAEMLAEVETLRTMAKLRVKELYELNDLINGAIYLESKGRLSKRIDFAWAVYQSDEVPDTYREEALKFLVYAFDIQEPHHINERLLELMAKKQAGSRVDPDFVPGKSLAVDIDDEALLSMETPTSTKGLGFFSTVDRYDYRIHIQNGLFKKNGKNFNTIDYAAFTLNAKGELLVFPDNIAHSAINAGSPVVSAGRLKIENGKLTAITTEGGDYNPSLFNVYTMLDHLAKNGVDIRGIDVMTSNNPSEQLPDIHSSYCPSSSGGGCYKTPVDMIYRDMKYLINENIKSIDAEVKNYKKGGLVSYLFRFKDWLFRSHLTSRRAQLAADLEAKLEHFQRELRVESITPGTIKIKIDELDSILREYQKANNDLSEEYKKASDSGRLAKKINHYKDHLQTLSLDEVGEQDVNALKRIK